MGTGFMEVISNYGMVEINDERLSQNAQENPALFFRQMWLYMSNAIPIFDRPPEMREYLAGGIVEPRFDSVEWVSSEESLEKPVTVNTGFLGHELFRCSLMSYDGTGGVTALPCAEVSYDPETGEVKFPVQKQAGLIYTMDFYTDGSFKQELTIAQKRILGLCMAMVWQERFAGDWLNMQPKIKDKSFNVGSEHAHMAANTARLREMRAALAGELRKYEQDCAYAQQMRSPDTFRRFV